MYFCKGICPDTPWNGAATEPRNPKEIEMLSSYAPAAVCRRYRSSETTITTITIACYVNCV